MKIFDYIELKKKYNTLKLNYDNLVETLKSETYKKIMKEIKEFEELKKLKKENKRLRLKIKKRKETNNGKIKD